MKYYQNENDEMATWTSQFMGWGSFDSRYLTVFSICKNFLSKKNEDYSLNERRN